MTSYGGFVWPRSGPVECPDWDPTPECGHGLHGLLDGEGDGRELDWSAGAVWLVACVDNWVDLGDKVKTPRAVVVYVGDRVSATAWLVQRCPGRAIAGAIVVAGDHGTATVGYRGTAVVGRFGRAIVGHHGVAIVGDDGVATVGDGGRAVVGHGGTAVVGRFGRATAGSDGAAIVGDQGVATAGS
jgi:hypothetical protein